LSFGIKKKIGINPKKPLKNNTSPIGYVSADHFTTKSIKENAQIERNMHKKPN